MLMVRKASVSWRKLILVHHIIKIQLCFQIQLHLDQRGPGGPAQATCSGKRMKEGAWVIQRTECDTHITSLQMHQHTHTLLILF